MVDVVYAWVNGAENAHAKKKNYWLKEEVSENLDVGSVDSTRFLDSGELWYSIKLLKKNAPWIRNIYLVTDNQKPHWLTVALEKELSLQVVDHRVIFSGYENYLPTFNSRTIETMIYNIPGCDDEIIYFNDDVFLVNPVNYEDFFRNGKIVLRGKLASKFSFVDRLFRRIIRKKYYGLVGRRPMLSNVANGLFYYDIAHVAHPIRITSFKEIFSVPPFPEKNIKYRFRGKKQISPIGYYVNVQRNRECILIGNRDWIYVNSAIEGSEKVNNKLEICKKDRSMKILCVQSLDLAPSDVRTEVFSFLKECVLD